MSNEQITIAHLCANVLKRKPNAVRMAWKRAHLTNFDQRRTVTPEELRTIMEYYSGRPVPEMPSKPIQDEIPAKPIVVVRQSAKQLKPEGGIALPLKRAFRPALLILAILLPTAASLKNMYLTTVQISEDHYTAVFYTGLIAATPLILAITGISRWWAAVVTVVLIAAEVFCNMTRIYYGLMYGSNVSPHTTPSPVRFLGTVTEIFNTGSAGTAIAIGLFAGVMIAAVQFTALFSLKNNLSTSASF